MIDVEEIEDHEPTDWGDIWERPVVPAPKKAGKAVGAPRVKKDAGGYEDACTSCGARYFRGPGTPYICGRCSPREPVHGTVDWSAVPGSSVVAKQTQELLAAMSSREAAQDVAVEKERARGWR